MLELAHKLADSDAKFFGGWVLAGAEAHIHQPAEAMANQVLLAKERKSIIRVAGTATDGSLAKELRVFLVLPKHKLGTKPLEPEAIKGDLLTKHTFTTQEIADYVAYTGDENVIHKSEHPIVPGLCMAAWLPGGRVRWRRRTRTGALPLSLLFTLVTSCASTGQKVSLLLM